MPGGNVVAATIDVARTVARRSERSAVAIGDTGSLATTYLNRLSDLMFVLARVLNRMDGGDDVYWKSERLAQQNATE